MEGIEDYGESTLKGELMQKGSDSIAKDVGTPTRKGKKGGAKMKKPSWVKRWAEASNWNPDYFETHPARRKLIAGRRPIPPRQG